MYERRYRTLMRTVVLFCTHRTMLLVVRGFRWDVRHRTMRE